MKFWGLLIIGAVSPYLFKSTLPNHVALAMLLLTGLLILLVPALRLYCTLPVVFLVTTLSINDRLAERMAVPEGRSQLAVTGKVVGLPRFGRDMTSFNFMPDKPAPGLPGKIRVNWYEPRNDGPGHERKALPVIRAGEHWRLQLALRPARTRVNFHGVDIERWYFAAGVGALATVQDGQNRKLTNSGWYDLHHVREEVSIRLNKVAGDTPAFRILSALAIADRRGLLDVDRQMLAATGTGHLLAISGLHIGLAAAMGFFIGRLFLLLVPMRYRQLISVALPWLTAWQFALAYSALSGFGVSTQRALIMLSVLTFVTLSRREVHPLLGWMVAMALVLLVDPFAPLRAGFWLSFLAVGILMMLFVPRHGHLPWWRKILMAQLGISLIMAPLSMLWFQQASLPGFLANLVAIPVVSVLVVPLVLMGILTLFWVPTLSTWLLTAASYFAGGLLGFLEHLARWQPDAFSATLDAGLVTTLLAMTGAVALMLPRGMPGRPAGLLLAIPLVLPAVDRLSQEEVRVDIIDAGQGLAVLISDHEERVLYDTGPGNGRNGEDGWDIVPSDIYPMIREGRRDPGLIVVSHADLDHSGGLESLRSLFPDAPVLATLPNREVHDDKCLAGMSWRTPRMNFDVLHPSAGLPYLGNDSSCVVSMKGAGFSLLLSGDISQVVERRLVEAGLQHHTLLTVPHHGSLSSSSAIFIKTVRPEWAIIPAGVDNRFSFPRQEVLARYAALAVPTLSTADCGGIRISVGESGRFRIESARIVRDRIWRWPAARNCP